MKQYLIDTNFILRFLLKDNLKQAKIAYDYLTQAKDGHISIFVPLLVFVESVYILAKLYKFKKEKIVRKLTTIAELSYLGIEKRIILQGALNLYSSQNISFIDAVFCAQAKLEGKEFLTFDKRLKKLHI